MPVRSATCSRVQHGGHRSAVLLNAAGGIAAAGHAADLREGLELAREAIDSGAAAEGSTSSSLLAERHSRDGEGLMGRFRDALAGHTVRRGLPYRAIAEVKRRSPSAGDLRPSADPAEIAAAYERAGAAAVSILVDAERFGGSWDDLRAARSATALPLLAKGFFTH